METRSQEGLCKTVKHTKQERVNQRL